MKAFFDRARELGVDVQIGYGEDTGEGRYNTAVYVSGKTGEVLNKYRKVGGGSLALAVHLTSLPRSLSPRCVQPVWCLCSKCPSYLSLLRPRGRQTHPRSPDHQDSPCSRHSRRSHRTRRLHRCRCTSPEPPSPSTSTQTPPTSSRSGTSSPGTWASTPSARCRSRPRRAGRARSWGS